MRTLLQIQGIEAKALLVSPLAHPIVPCASPPPGLQPEQRQEGLVPALLREGLQLPSKQHDTFQREPSAGDKAGKTGLHGFLVGFRWVPAPVWVHPWLFQSLWLLENRVCLLTSMERRPGI